MSSVPASPAETPSSPSTPSTGPSPGPQQEQTGQQQQRQQRSRSQNRQLQAPPRVPWSTLQSELARNWKQGQHITIAAPAGHGKTHLALALAELSRFVLVLATKRRDPLVAD